MDWNFDVESAPKGYLDRRETVNKKGSTVTSEVFVPYRCIIATKCKKVTFSHILESGRWLNLATGEQPIAWQAAPIHPEEAQ